VFLVGLPSNSTLARTCASLRENPHGDLRGSRSVDAADRDGKQMQLTPHRCACAHGQRDGVSQPQSAGNFWRGQPWATFLPPAPRSACPVWCPLISVDSWPTPARRSLRPANWRPPAITARPRPCMTRLPFRGLRICWRAATSAPCGFPRPRCPRQTARPRLTGPARRRRRVPRQPQPQLVAPAGSVLAALAAANAQALMIAPPGAVCCACCAMRAACPRAPARPALTPAAPPLPALPCSARARPGQQAAAGSWRSSGSAGGRLPLHRPPGLAARGLALPQGAGSGGSSSSSQVAPGSPAPAAPAVQPGQAGLGDPAPPEQHRGGGRQAQALQPGHGLGGVCGPGHRRPGAGRCAGCGQAHGRRPDPQLRRGQAGVDVRAGARARAGGGGGPRMPPGAANARWAGKPGARRAQQQPGGLGASWRLHAEQAACPHAPPCSSNGCQHQPLHEAGASGRVAGRGHQCRAGGRRHGGGWQ